MNSHQMLSQIIELFGFVMQLAILAMLIVRRQALKFPAFGLTLIFFLLRAVLYYTAGHYPAVVKALTTAQWGQIILGLSTTEDALQVAIVVELLWWLVPALNAWRSRIYWQLAVGAMVGVGFIAVMLKYLGYWPGATVGHGASTRTLLLMNGHVGLVSLTAELLILAALAAVSGETKVQALGSKLALGWGLFGSVNLIGLAVGHYAMRTANAMLWERTQYVVIGAYVLMLVLWLVGLIVFSENKAELATAK